MTPIRLDLTMRLARCLGVLDRVAVCAPVAATEAELLAVHSADYLAAVRTASSDPGYLGYGLGSADNPVFDGMFDAAALIAGGSRLAAELIWQGQAEHAVNIAGGLHHAMAGSAAGFCVLNDVVLAIRTLLAAGAAAGRLRRRRRPPRRRRAGGLLRRPTGADHLAAPGSAHALPGHRVGRTRPAPARRPAPRSTWRCRRAPPTTVGCAASTRWCPARWPPSGRTCWSPSAVATPITRIRWPTWR